jgi:hypothetical protein
MSPVSCEKNLFSEGHEQVRSMMLCQRCPGDEGKQENKAERNAGGTFYVPSNEQGDIPG